MQLQVLGPVQATDNGETVALGGPRQRAVLALLVAFANEPVSSDRIIDEIWGDEPPPEARNSLQSMISNLRKALQPDDRFAINRNGRSYELVAPVEGVDSLLFVTKVESARQLVESDINGAIGELAAALQLWRGEPYGDVDEADSLRADRARLEELRLRALETRIEGEMSIGRSADMVGELERLIGQEPLREGLHRLMMVALVDSGRQSEALRVAGRLRQTLAADLGIEPSPELVSLEQQILEQRIAAPTAAQHSVPNPYRGLESFTEADADRFFGRDSLTERLVERMAEDGEGYRLLAVVGASGSGKSSVVRAGLIPALRQGAVPGSADWVIVQMVPGATPLRDLEAALLRVAVNPPPTLLEQLTRDDLGLRDAADRILPDSGSELLVMVDQFEEIFTTADADEAAQLINVIVGAANASDSRVRIVITLRADFYDRPLGHAGLAPLLAKRLETVVAMTPDELGEAIVGPAHSVGVEVEPGLVAAVVADATGQPGALPLVQFALTEIFDKPPPKMMTLEGYRNLGGIRGAIGRRAEVVYGAFAPAIQAEVASRMLQLVTLSDGEEAARQRVARRDIAGENADAILEAFGSARLLAFDLDSRTGAPTVEVAHEALLREWPRLSAWIDEGKDDLRIRRQLATAAAEWAAAAKDPAFLMSGRRLDTITSWYDERSGGVGALELEYLNASTDAAKAERRRASRVRRRIQTALATSAILALIFGAIAVVRGIQATRDARIAEVRELASSAVSLIDRDAELAVLLAIEAVEREPIPAAQEALHQALAAHRVVAEFDAPGSAADFLDDSTLAVLTADGRIEIRPLDGGAPAAVIGDPGLVELAAADDGATATILASRDGQRLAVGTPTGSLVVADVASGASWTRQLGVATPQLSFNEDATLIAARSTRPTGADVRNFERSEESTGAIFDVATGNVVRELGTCCGQAVAFAYDPAKGTEVLVVTRTDQNLQRLVQTDVATGARLSASSRQVGDFATAGGRLYAVQGQVGTEVQVFDTPSGSEIATLLGHTADVTAIAFDSIGTRLAAASVDGSVRIWDARTGAEQLLLSSQPNVMASVQFSPSGELLLTTTTSGLAQLWDVTASGRGEVAEARFEDTLGRSPVDAAWIPGTSDVLLRARFMSPDTHRLSTSTNDGDTYVHGAGDAMAVSPDGRKLAMSNGRILLIHDLEGAATRARLIPPGAYPGGRGIGVVYNGDGSLVAAASREGDVDVYRTGDDSLYSTFTVETEPLRGVHFHGNDQLLVVDAAGRVEVREAGSGAVIRSWVMAGDVSLAGSLYANGLVVVGDNSGGWQSSSVATGEPMAGVENAHAGPIEAGAISRDASLLATAGPDSRVTVWDLATGEELYTLTGATDLVTALAFNDDASMLVVASDDRLARVFTLDPDRLLEVGRARTVRSLTEAECRRYLRSACD